MTRADTGRSYYSVLNVSRSASEDDIKRAYRQLVQVYHPDKHANTSLQAGADANFTLVQQAYEVLGDSHKRQIYDIYGKQGLTSGMEVATRASDTADEMKRKWAQFQAQEAQQAEAGWLDFRGVYAFRFNAEHLIKPFGKREWPTFEGASVSATQQATLAPNTHVSLATYLNVDNRPRAPGIPGQSSSSVMLQLRHATSHLHALQANIGLGSLTQLNLQSTYQLTQHQSAAVALTYQPGAGVGMQVTTARRLSKSSNGEATLVLGPAGGVQGIIVAHKRQFQRCSTTVNVEVGAQDSVSGRVGYKYNKRTYLHATARASLAEGGLGLIAEVGGRYKWSDTIATGLALGVSPRGIMYRGTLNAGEHRIEVPIVLCSDWDPRVIFWAGVAPPVVMFTVSRLLLRPLRRRYKLRKALQQARDGAAAWQGAFKRAADSHKLVEGVAARKLRAELAKGGLVIINAKYGTHSAIRQAEEEARQQRHEGQLSSQQRQRSDLEESDALQDQPAHPSGHQSEGDTDTEDEDEEENQEVQQAVEAQIAREQQPGWLDVTTPLRFMLDNSSITFHQGLAKSDLMGFCDCAPGQSKELKVLFLHNREPRVCTLADKEGGVLPLKGRAVTDHQIAEDMLADLEDQRRTTNENRET